MGNWYRRPKTLNLKYLLRDSAYEFVFDALQVSAEEHLELQQILGRVYSPYRLRRERRPVATPNRILIVWDDANHQAPSYGLEDRWQGVLLVPADVHERRAVLTTFFTKRVRYRVSQPSWSAFRGKVPPFLLDLTKAPALITPAELVLQPRYR